MVMMCIIKTVTKGGGSIKMKNNYCDKYIPPAKPGYSL